MVRPADPVAWQELLRQQDNLVSRRQCRSHGISADAAQRAVVAGRWRRVFTGTFQVGTQPLSPLCMTRAALLEIGGLVVACHDTALWLADPRRPAPPIPHVAVVEGRMARRREGLALHWLPDLGEPRVLWSSDPPRVEPAWATLDLVNEATTDDERARLLARTVSDGLASVDALREALDLRPRMRAREVVRDLLSDVAEGAQSPLEVRDLRNDRRHGLASQRQVIVPRGERRDRVDVIYTGHGLRRRVIKELDGRLGHEGADGHWRDLGRDNAAEERDESHLRYGWVDVVGRPCEVAAQTYRVLRLHGWQEPFRRCGPGCTGPLS